MEVNYLYGIIHPDTFQKMEIDFIVKKIKLTSISERYKIAEDTVRKLAREHKWRRRRKEYDKNIMRSATVDRDKIANIITGYSMKIFENHSRNLYLKSIGLKPEREIPKDVINDALVAMTYMDKVKGIILKTKENISPDSIEVIGNDINEGLIYDRYMENKDDKGREQLKEWEESMNPSIKEDSDIFEQQAKPKEIEAPKEDKEEDDDIFFAGIDDD